MEGTNFTPHSSPCWDNSEETTTPKTDGIIVLAEINLLPCVEEHPFYCLFQARHALASG